MKHWYVYIAVYNGEVVYIGKGKESRYEHINSGVSNCYEANRVHFEGGEVECSLYASFVYESDALTFEKDLILEYKPAWNITYTDNPTKKSGRGDKRFLKRGSSEYKGVTYREKPSGGKNAGTVAKHWRAKVHHLGKTLHIGNYAREVDAAIARDLFVINNNIPARLNFPDKNYSEVLDEHVELD